MTAPRCWTRKLQAFTPATKTLNKQLESSENDFIGILKNKGLQQPRECPIKKKPNLKRWDIRDQSRVRLPISLADLLRIQTRERPRAWTEK